MNCWKGHTIFENNVYKSWVIHELAKSKSIFWKARTFWFAGWVYPSLTLERLCNCWCVNVKSEGVIWHIYDLTWFFIELTACFRSTMHRLYSLQDEYQELETFLLSFGNNDFSLYLICHTAYRQTFNRIQQPKHICRVRYLIPLLILAEYINEFQFLILVEQFLPLHADHILVLKLSWTTLWHLYEVAQR
jgi:hypothetical protein